MTLSRMKNHRIHFYDHREGMIVLQQDFQTIDVLIHEQRQVPLLVWFFVSMFEDQLRDMFHDT